MLGLLLRQPAHRFAYESDVYRLELGPDGVQSLRAGGAEFVRTPSAAVAVALGLRALDCGQTNLTDGFLADGTVGLFVTPAPARVTLALGSDDAEREPLLALFPATGVHAALAVDGDRRRARLTAPNGVALELTADAPLVALAEGGLGLAVPCGQRVGVTVQLPASAWQGAATVAVEAVNAPDHQFAAGRLVACRGTVTVTAPDRPVRLVAQVEDLNTGETVHTDELPLAPGADGVASFAWTLPWSRPGPWRFHLIAAAGPRALGVKSGVFIADLPAWRPAIPCPPDFDAFWATTLAELRRVPLAPYLIRQAAKSDAGYAVYEVEITGWAGRRLRGRYGEPTAPGPHPVTLGAWHRGANEEAARWRGVCMLSHALDGLGRYRTGYDDVRHTNLFYSIVDALRWVDFLATRPRVDLARSLLYAGSRGGPIALAVLALDRRVRRHIANVPTNNCWQWQVTQPGAAGGWGPWPADRPAALSPAAFATLLSYLEPAHFAARVTQPCLIGLGLLDGLSPIAGNLAAAMRLGGETHLCLAPWAGHTGAGADWNRLREEWERAVLGVAPAAPTPGAPR